MAQRSKGKKMSEVINDKIPNQDFNELKSDNRLDALNQLRGRKTTWLFLRVYF